MVTLIAIILLGIAIFCGIRFFRQNLSDEYAVLMILCVILFFGCGVFIVSDIYEIGTSYTIDEKIKMYEEENYEIESKIDSIVSAYKIFESENYKKYKIEDSEDAMVLVSLFPELKSDTVVQEQIELYIANNGKIKELKEEKIDVSKSKWRIYFGK